MSDLPEGVQMIEGTLDARGARFTIVVSRFNAFITERLLEGAVDTLCRMGTAATDITVVRVPGAWELPQTCAKVLQRTAPDAVIALGCLIKGDTIHFDLIAGEVAKGLSTLGQAHGVPVVFGVLTTDTLEQSVHRAGAKFGNKGAEAAQTAIEQIALYRALDSATGVTAPTQPTARGAVEPTPRKSPTRTRTKSR